MIEVEQKYRVSDPTAFQHRLGLAGFQSCSAYRQTDHYFQHPCRDFSQTDEALRLRQENGQTLITYKGPKRLGVCKQREELEFPIVDDGNSMGLENMCQLFQHLGFRPVAHVDKTRQPWKDAVNRELQVMVDHVQELGNDGWFCEIECLVEEDSPESMQQAIDDILQLAQRLGLKEIESRSYLELILQRQASV